MLTGIKENTQNYKLPFPNDLNEKPLIDAGLTDSHISILRKWLDEITPKKMSIEGAPHAHKMSLQGAPHAQKMSLEGGVDHPKRLVK